MVILFLSNNLCLGGKERQIVEILETLSKDPCYRLLLLLRQNRIEINLFNLERVTVISPKKALSFFGFVRFLRKALKQNNPDIVHCWEGMVTTAAILTRATLRRKFPIIAGSIQYARKYRFNSKTALINRFNVIFSEMVIANSQAGLAAINCFPGNKFHVLPNGFDLTRFPAFQRGSDSEKSVRIGMVASFTAAKDYFSFVIGAVELLDSGVDLQIECIGDGPERTAIERSVPAKYRDSFNFLGALPNDETLKNINKWGIAVLLSKKGHSEGMSNAIMEYMMLGKPVICTNTGGNPELIKEGINGYLIPHEDHQQLIEKLRRLISNKELCRFMGESSRKIAMENFEIENVTSKLLVLYKQLMKK